MHKKKLDDENLVLGLKKGEGKAYSFLVDTYHHKLCIYAFGLINDRDSAEDIVQNVFISLWNHRLNLKDDFSIKSYLYKSVYNEFIDQYRKKKNVLALEKKYIDALSHIVEEEDETTLMKQISLLHKEIDNLPKKCKKVFLLSKQEGLTNIEIAEYLEVSIKSVEAHITKAFRILRKTLNNKVHNLLFLLFKVHREKIHF